MATLIRIAVLAAVLLLTMTAIEPAAAGKITAMLGERPWVAASLAEFSVALGAADCHSCAGTATSGHHHRACGSSGPRAATGSVLVVRLIAAVVPGTPDVPRRLGAPYPCVGRQPAADHNAVAALLVVPREPAMVSGRPDLLWPWSG